MPINAVVFDIGQVLVRIDFTSLLAFLGPYGFGSENVLEWLMQVDLPGHERGEFDGDELLHRFVSLARGDMPLAGLRKEWLGLFRPDESMLEMARGLAATHRVYLMSNIGDLHWDYLDGRIGVGSIGHGALPSFRVRACKPDPAIYAAAEQSFGLDPACTVFIDDMKANVAEAGRRGWHAIRHRDAESTRQRLRELGVPA